MRDDLEEGETLDAVYDVHFPDKPVPLWKFILYSIMTLGVYPCAHYVRRCCYKHKCCAPPYTEMRRAKMALTSKDRLIIWTTDVEQRSNSDNNTYCCCCCCCLCCRKICCLPCMLLTWLYKILLRPRRSAACCSCTYSCCAKCDADCDPPVEYEAVTQTQICNLSSIREVTQFCCRKQKYFLGCCCCAEYYEAGLRIHFNAFQSQVQPSKFLKYTAFTVFFLFVVQCLRWLVRAIVLEPDYVTLVWLIIIGVGLSLTLFKLLFLAAADNGAYHPGDIVKTYPSKFYKDIVASAFGSTTASYRLAMSSFSNVSQHTDNETPDFVDILSLRDGADEHGDLEHPTAESANRGLRQLASMIAARVLRCQNVNVWENRSDLAKQLGSEEFIPPAPILEKGHPFFAPSLVEEDSVTVPKECLELVEDQGEVAVTASSGLYSLTTLDKYLIMATCGLYYLFSIRARLQFKTGIIITTKRIAVIVVYDDLGIFDTLYNLIFGRPESTRMNESDPEAGACCCPVTHGIAIRHLFPGRTYGGTISKESAGAFTLNACIGTTSERVTGRILTDGGIVEISFPQINDLPTNERGDRNEAQNKLQKKLDFLKVLSTPISRSQGKVLIGSNVEPQNDDMTVVGISADLQLNNIELALLPMLKNEEVVASYAAENAKDVCWFPFCNNYYHGFKEFASCSTCGLLPKFEYGRVFVTPQTIYAIKTASNYPYKQLWSHCSKAVTTHEFLVTWAPATEFVTSRVHTELAGNATCCSRKHRDTCLGKACCNMLNSRGYISILMNGSIVTLETESFQPIRADSALKAFRCNIAKFATAVHNENRNDVANPPHANATVIDDTNAVYHERNLEKKTDETDERKVETTIDKNKTKSLLSYS